MLGMPYCSVHESYGFLSAPDKKRGPWLCPHCGHKTNAHHAPVHETPGTPFLEDEKSLRLNLNGRLYAPVEIRRALYDLGLDRELIKKILAMLPAVDFSKDYE